MKLRRFAAAGRFAVAAAVAAATAVGCGRGSLRGDSGGGSIEGLRVRIDAPDEAPLHVDCDLTVGLQLVDAAGDPVADSIPVSVRTSVLEIDGDLVGSPGDLTTVTTDSSGAASISVGIASTPASADPVFDTIEAEVPGSGAPKGRHDLVLRPNQAPVGQLAWVGTAGLLSNDGSVFTAVDGTARLFVSVVDDDVGFDLSAVPFATDDPSLLPKLLQLTGTAGTAVGAVTRGPHVVLAEYTDCAGERWSERLDFERGTKVELRVGTASTPPLASNQAVRVDVDRGNPERAWIGFGETDRPEIVEIDVGAQTWSVASTTNPAQVSHALRWFGTYQGAPSFVGSFEGAAAANGITVWNAASGAAATTSASPYNATSLKTAVCGDGVAYVGRELAIYLYPNAMGLTGGTLTENVVALEARPDGTHCELFVSNANGLRRFRHDPGSLQPATLERTWSSPSAATTIGFAGDTAWAAAGAAIWAIPAEEGSSPVIVHQGTIAPEPGFDGFSLSSLTRVVGGLVGGVPTVWVGNATPAAGQEGLVRLVVLTPRSARGSERPERTVPLPYRATELRRSVRDIAVRRTFGGEIAEPWSVWAATDAGLVHVTWTD